MKNLLPAALGAAVLAGCASNPDKISSSYVSPLKYKNHDCEQIAMEMDHVSRRTSELYYQLKGEADADAAQMGVGLVLFWPALFFLEGGDGPQAAEYSRLKGEHEALQSAAIDKKCAMEDLPPSPQEIIEEKRKGEEAQTAETGDKFPE